LVSSSALSGFTCTWEGGILSIVWFYLDLGRRHSLHEVFYLYLEGRHLLYCC
jgi:hypothetical protein